MRAFAPPPPPLARDIKFKKRRRGQKAEAEVNLKEPRACTHMASNSSVGFTTGAHLCTGCALRSKATYREGHTE